MALAAALLRYCLLLLLLLLLARMHFLVDTIHLDSCVTRRRHLCCVRARPPAQQCRLPQTVEQAATCHLYSTLSKPPTLVVARHHFPPTSVPSDLIFTVVTLISRVNILLINRGGPRLEPDPGSVVKPKLSAM